MKFALISLFLMLFAITYGVFANPAGSNAADSHKINVISVKDYLAQHNHQARSRRDCDCTTTTGLCVSYGNYQCYFSGGASIVQCVGGNQWTTIGTCPNSCQMYGNQQPYCT